MRIAASLMALTLTACSGGEPVAQSEPDIFERLQAYCGQAYEGQVASDDPRDADWAAETLTIHFRECSEDEIRIPLHVGEDRSRTWVVSRLDDGRLRLKHDHRHEDGSEDVLTQYGGDSLAAPGTFRVEFPADQFSKDLFEREDIPVSMANVWSLSLDGEHENHTLTYALDRPDRHFAAAFDLSQPVETPPPPWGHE